MVTYLPFLTPFLEEGSPTKIDYRKKGTLILTSLLEDLVGCEAFGKLAVSRMGTNGHWGSQGDNIVKNHNSAGATNPLTELLPLGTFPWVIT